MLITSLENDRVKNYVRLKDRKHRKATQTFIVEGLHLVIEAYKKGAIIELILEKDEVVPMDVPIVYVTKEIINKISSLDNPSNVMALCRMNEQEDDLGDRVLLLDDIQDPGNLGTIIRSSLALGVDTIVLSPNTVDLYNPKVLRATQGMLFHINIITKDLASVIERLKAQEIPVYGTKLDFGEDVRNLKEKDRKRYGLVMGNEGQGVSSKTLELCDKYLYIDMNPLAESLNVAVACSIIIYELNR